MQRFTYLSICSLVVIFIGMSLGSRAQNYNSQNNYTGAWESNVSWVGTNSPGLNFNQNADVNVNGEISSSANLFFNKGELIVIDTLVVNGDLGFGSNGDLSVVAGGVLIVLGSLDVGNKVDIAAGGTIIITGNVNFSGSSGQGSFTSTETPSQVYIGGVLEILPPLGVNQLYLIAIFCRLMSMKTQNVIMGLSKILRAKLSKSIFKRSFVEVESILGQ